MGSWFGVQALFEPHALRVQVRTRVRQELDAALQDCTVLVGPSTTGPAFRLGSVVQDPLAMYKADMTTVALNLAGEHGCEAQGCKGSPDAAPQHEWYDHGRSAQCCCVCLHASLCRRQSRIHLPIAWEQA